MAPPLGCHPSRKEEALAALRLFQEAAEHEAATAELAGRFLHRAQLDPGLRFEGAS